MPVPDDSGNLAIITCWTTSAGIKAMHLIRVFDDFREE
jgi:hypothetical protein